jgi:hypothetical protein
MAELVKLILLVILYSIKLLDHEWIGLKGLDRYDSWAFCSGPSGLDRMSDNCSSHFLSTIVIFSFAIYIVWIIIYWRLVLPLSSGTEQYICSLGPV